MIYKLMTAVSRSLLVLVCFGSATFAKPLELIGWNIESGGADPAIIASQLAKLPKVDAYLLQEVNPSDLGRLAAAVRKAHGGDYKYYMESLGGSDRLAMIIAIIDPFGCLLSFPDENEVAVLLKLIEPKQPATLNLPRAAFEPGGQLLIAAV